MKRPRLYWVRKMPARRPVQCIALLLGILAVGAAPKDRVDPAKAETRLRALGGHLDRDLSTREIIEVRLNNRALKDDDLRWLGAFPHIRALSVENTAIGDRALAYISGLDGL